MSDAGGGKDVTTDLYELVARVMRRLEEQHDDDRRDVATLRAAFAQVLEILVGTGALNEGHRRLIDKVGARAANEVRPRVRLRQYVDKYQIEPADIDCASLIPICKARCCTFTFDLTTQDLDEGKVRWEIERPYLIRHELDLYCTHIDRPTGGCTIHAHRPATCRSFDCREDPRIWLDFEKRIPAPMPVGMISKVGAGVTGVE